MWTHIRADETPDPSRGAWTGKRPSQRNPRDNGSAERSCRYRNHPREGVKVD